MQQTVEQHIDTIRAQIETITAELSATTDPLLTHHLSADIRAMRLALAHYELALQLEKEVIHERMKRSA
jgi:hypothetical protein